MTKKVAVVVTDLFEDSELESPMKALKDAGHTATLIDMESGKTIKGKKGMTAQIDKSIDEVSPEDFDALLIPGGYSPDSLRKHDSMLKFTKAFSDDKKPIFAICHGPQLLINAEVIEGKAVTSAPQVAIDLKNAGAKWEDSEVVKCDTGLISSRKPDDLPAFNKAMLEALES